MPCASVFHRFVFRRTENLIAGRIHHYRVTNMRNLFIFQSAAADSFMHIFAPNGDILAENDDFTGLASEIIFTPTVSGPATLMIRAFSTKTPGVCDLEKGLDGNPPTPLNTNLVFFGVTAFASWNAGDVFSTSNSTGDPFLFLRTGSQMLRDDDSGPGLNSRLVVPTAGTGRLILGSFALSSEGSCDCCLDPGAGPVTLSFNLSERPFEQGRRQATPESAEMQNYVSELRDSKEGLEELEPEERETKVAELQERHLPSDERRQMVLPAPQAAADFVRLQNIYLELYREMEPELEKLSYEDRAQRVAELKTRIVGEG